MRTTLKQIIYKTPSGDYTVSKDDLAAAQAILGNSNVGWPQCRDTKEGIEFFLDICELFNLKFVPQTLSKDKKILDTKDIYFDLCDEIALAELPVTVENTGRDFSEFINNPLEADIYNAYNNREDTSIIDVKSIEEVVVKNVEVTPAKTAVEIFNELVDEAEKELTEEYEAAVTEEVSEGTNETNQNIIEEESVMNTNASVNFNEMIEETAKEMVTENINKEGDAMSAQERIENATNEAGKTIKDSMGVINKYVSEFRIEAKKIGTMSDKEVYDYIMRRIDKNIDTLAKWSGGKFTNIANILNAQKEKMKKAKEDAEDAIEDENLDDKSKASVLSSIKSFFGKIIKATLIALKAATKLTFKLAGIVLTFAYRVGRTVVTEGISAGIAMKDAVIDTVKEVRDGLPMGNADKTEDNDTYVEEPSFRTESEPDLN